MWRKGKCIPAEKRKQLYYAYVQSHLMLPIYSLSNKRKMNELQTIQNSCVKAMCHLHRRTPTTYLCSVNLLPLRPLAIVERVTHPHKMLKLLTKHSFDIKLNRDVNERETRRRSEIHITRQHPSLSQSINEYNRLSSEIRRMSCIDTFKSKLKLKIMSESEEFNIVSPFFHTK